MDMVIKLTMDTISKNIDISEDLKLCLKSLFSGCRVNFLLGAGFSANILGVLNNNEIVYEAVRQFQSTNEIQRKKCKILKAYLHWYYFYTCIYPIMEKATLNSADFKQYKTFGNILHRIFSERSNPVLDRQFNIFTTNYDPIIELIFDATASCICNDGFEGRIHPKFSTDNFSKSYYRQAIFSNRKSEIPSVNVIKIHGSVTWSLDIIYGGIEYDNFFSKINTFFDKHNKLFDSTITNYIQTNLLDANPTDVTEQLTAIIDSNYFDSLIADIAKYEQMLQSYKSEFFIVNPTKEKFSNTLLNKNYYEMLRIFSNELEKENTLLVVYGFSFRDEHILDLTRRSMLNPSLKIIIFCYQEKDIIEYEKLFSDSKNRNITYIMLDKEKLSLEKINEILSCVHA